MNERGPYNGPQNVREWVKWARGRTRRDNDVIAAIAGDTGSGKSSLAVLLAPKLQDHPVQIEEQFLWASDALLNAARKCPEGSALVMDEAVVGGGNRRRAMSTANVDVMEHLNTCRTFHQIVLFLAPQFGDLDTAIQTRCNWLFLVTERGKFTAYEVTKTGGPKGRGAWLQERFRDVFPDPATHKDSNVRALWEEYKAAKERFSYRGNDPKAPLRERLIDEYRAKIRLVMDSQ